MGKTNTAPKGIEFGRIFAKYIKNWYIFGAAILIAIFFARDANKYIEPMYSLNTSILIEDKSNKSVLDERGSISDNPLYLGQKLIENQIAYLKSYSLVKRIVEKLDIVVSYYRHGEYFWTDIYKETPFLIEFNPDHQQVRYKTFKVKFNDSDGFSLSSDEYEPFKIEKFYKIGELIKGHDYEFKVVLREDKNIKDVENKTFGFKINDLNGLTHQYRNKTNVYIQKNTSLLVIGTSGSNKQKEKDYLNTLTQEFLQSNLDKKNKILTNTILFIDSQLVTFGGELEQVEQRLEDFRKKNKFMELSHKASALLNKMNSQSKSLSNLLLDLRYYEYLFEYLETHNDFEDITMPSTVGLSLPLFSDLVLKLSTVNLKKEDLIANATRENPFIQTLEEEIANNKEALQENMRSIIATTNIKIDDMEERMNISSNEFLKLPRMEREWLEIQRKYKVFNSIYDFLLRRKSEVEIQRAANLPDHEMFDRAGDTGISNISKRPKSNYVNALIWAILLPSIFLFLLVFFNDRIMAEEDVMAISSLPLAGSVIKLSGKKLAKPRTFFTESLRLIRIKLKLSEEKNEKVIVVSSSTTEEGKTFMSENMAMICGMTGKKTVLVSFDFRGPCVNPNFELDEAVGFSEFAADEIDLETVVQKTPYDNLHVILPGKKRPNIDELIDSSKTKMMFKYLREKFEYIIVDTPPLGVVGDAFLLNRYSDATLFVIRKNFTKKKVFAKAIHDAEVHNMKNINIVFNEVSVNQRDMNEAIYGDEIKPRALPIRLILKLRRILIDILRKI